MLHVKTMFIKSIISRIVTSVIKKNLGEGVDVRINGIDIWTDDARTQAQLNITLTATNEKIAELIDKKFA